MEKMAGEIFRFKERKEFIEKIIHLCYDYEHIITVEEYSLANKLEHELNRELKIE